MSTLVIVVADMDGVLALVGMGISFSRIVVFFAVGT